MTDTLKFCECGKNAKPKKIATFNIDGVVFDYICIGCNGLTNIKRFK